MRSIITLICGILVIASMFMKWYSYKFDYMGFDFTVYSESGWKAMSGSEVPWAGAVGQVSLLLGPFWWLP